MILTMWCLSLLQFTSILSLVLFKIKSQLFSYADRIFPYLRIAGAEEFIVLQTFDPYAIAADFIISAAPENGVTVTNHFMINDTDGFGIPSSDVYANVTDTVAILKDIPNIENQYVIYLGTNWELQVFTIFFFLSLPHFSFQSRDIY